MDSGNSRAFPVPLRIDSRIRHRESPVDLQSAAVSGRGDDVSGEPNSWKATARVAAHMAGLFCKLTIEQQERRQATEARLAKIEVARGGTVKGIEAQTARRRSRRSGMTIAFVKIGAFARTVTFRAALRLQIELQRPLTSTELDIVIAETIRHLSGAPSMTLH
jgi:hypothetical protein